MYINKYNFLKKERGNNKVTKLEKNDPMKSAQVWQISNLFGDHCFRGRKGHKNYKRIFKNILLMEKMKHYWYFLNYIIFCANLILNVVYHPCSSSTSCPSSKTIWSKSAAFWDSSWSTNTGSRNPWGYLLYLTWKKNFVHNHKSFGVQSSSFC